MIGSGVVGVTVGFDQSFNCVVNKGYDQAYTVEVFGKYDSQVTISKEK